MSAELFTVTVVEKMNLLSQVLTAASIDKYHIVLGERIVVASASSYDSIYADWLVLQEIKPEDFVGARKVPAEMRARHTGRT